MTVMQLLQRLANVREAVMAILERRLEEIAGQIAELRQQVIEAAVGNRVVAARRGRHRREADFPEAEFLGEVPIDLRTSSVCRVSVTRAPTGRERCRASSALIFGAAIA